MIHPIFFLFALLLNSEESDKAAVSDSAAPHRVLDGSPLPYGGFKDLPLAAIRTRRRWSLQVEGGLNALSGTMGFLGGYNIMSRLSLDVGLGITPCGGKHNFSRLEYQLGARARYQFFNSNVTPFVALGLTHSQLLFRRDGGHQRTLRIPGVVGVSFAYEKGFAALLSLGLAPAVAGPPSFKSSSPSDIGGNVLAALDFISFLGPIFSVSVGYAF